MAEATLQLPIFFYVRLLKCYDCEHWVGRCLKGKVNRIGVSETCELFKPKWREGSYTDYSHRRKGLNTLVGGLK